MPHTVLPDIPTGELKERLSRVRYVFTDLDGTMLAPGSCALADAEGNPCIDFVATLLELKRSGIEVIPCSGRNRSMLHEDTRLLGLNSYIGEMGGLLMLDRSDNRWEYFTADMPFNPIWGYSPHECIEATGILDEFQNRWPGLLEYHNDMSTGYKHREVTVGMRGEIPDEDARDIIRRSGAELDWGDNGYADTPATQMAGQSGDKKYVVIFPTDVRYDPSSTVQAEQYGQLRALAEGIDMNANHANNPFRTLQP